MTRWAFVLLGAFSLGVAAALAWLLYGDLIDDLIVDFD